MQMPLAEVDDVVGLVRCGSTSEYDDEQPDGGDCGADDVCPVGLGSVCEGDRRRIASIA